MTEHLIKSSPASCHVLQLPPEFSCAPYSLTLNLYSSWSSRQYGSRR